MADIAIATVALAGEMPAAFWARLDAMLSPQERRYVTRYRRDDQRRQSLAAHALKHLLLVQAAGRRRWTFGTGPFGKPLILDDGAPHFNLSHCDGLVAGAVSRDVPLGIDVEPVGDTDEAAVVDHYLTPAERESLAGLSAPARRQAFVRMWTLKEAFAKATGRGVAQDLRAVATTLEPLGLHPPAEAPETQLTWHCRQVLDGRHVLSLCWPGPPAAVHRRTLALADLAD